MMPRQDASETSGDEGFGAWFAFWIQLAVLAVLAVLGAFFASAARGPGDYGCGLTLTLSALALGFLRLKRRFDGSAGGWQAFLLVDRAPNLMVVIPLFTLIGLVGLFLAAAWESGTTPHDAGIGLFGASGLIIFLSLKRVFDTLDRHR